MAELYRPRRRGRHGPASPDDLPGLGRLGDQDMLRLGLDQLTAGVATLSDSITGAGLPTPSLAALQNRIDSAGHEDRRQAVMELHVELLVTLTAANFRLGKAYGLGRALADTCRSPVDMESVRREFRRHRIATMQKWLDDLGSALPPHAGHSVGTSLYRWTEWVDAGAVDRESDARTLSLLRRQGDLWRALLSGEKLGPDMLEAQNYINAASGLLRRLRLLLLQFIIRFPLVVLLVVALFAGGVWLILAQDTKGSIAAGLGGIAASVGITWKSIGGPLGRAADALEQPLWGAEMDAAIVDAITLLPDNKRDHKERGLVAIQADAEPPSYPAAKGPGSDR